jgi:hypothetical protein
VKVLLFDWNMLTSINIKYCSYLIKLDVQHNAVRHIQHNTFIDCQSLLFLNVSSNLITVLLGEMFKGLNNLISLDISGNPIKSIESGAFMGLDDLPTLSISSMTLLKVDDCVFQNLRALSSLKITNVHIPFIGDQFLCHMPALRKITLMQTSVKYIRGNPFQNLPSLEAIETDLLHVCCLLGDTSLCEVPLSTKHTQMCSVIIPSFLLKIITWNTAGLIIILNVYSFILWLMKRGNMKWLIYIFSLNTSDLLMGVYLLIVGIADLYYSSTYSSWSSGAWKDSWLCGLAMACSQFSYQTSLCLLALHSVDSLLLTKFAMKRINLTSSQAISSLNAAVIVSVVLSAGNNVQLSATPSTDVPSMCMFSGLGQRISVVSVFAFCYNALIVVVLGSVNTVIGVYFIAKKSVHTNKRQRRKERVLVVRILITTTTNLLAWLVLTVVQIQNVAGYHYESNVLTYLQLIALTMNAMINPVINTYTSVHFCNWILRKIRNRE